MILTNCFRSLCQILLPSPGQDTFLSSWSSPLNRGRRLSHGRSPQMRLSLSRSCDRLQSCLVLRLYTAPLLYLELVQARNRMNHPPRPDASYFAASLEAPLLYHLTQGVLQRLLQKTSHFHRSLMVSQIPVLCRQMFALGFRNVRRIAWLLISDTLLSRKLLLCLMVFTKANYG